MVEMQENLDLFWIIICSVLVFVMQAGFLCLEAGLTRRKNSINVAIKNLADFCVTTIIFWLIGFAIMFGESNSGWYGTTGFLIDFTFADKLFSAFFLFQIMFCGAAVTIVSGAVAERLRFNSYLIITTIIAGIVYPVFGHWAWAGLLEGEANGWLNGLGFVDFAGSSVVHSVGGWASLATLAIVGARRGRFLANGKSVRIPASNLPLATLGVVFLFIGWMGFNGGSTLALNGQVPHIIINTIIAGSIGALSAGLLGFAVQRQLNVGQFMNGCLGGLVAITASAYAVTTPSAIMIGLVGGMVVIGVEEMLEYFKIDDVVGAIPVHLGSGIWGTIAVGLYGDLDILGTGLSRIDQILIQLLGVVACGIWAFGMVYSALFIINKFHKLRVSAEHEDAGLNISEHGVQDEFDSYSLNPVHMGEEQEKAKNFQSIN